MSGLLLPPLEQTPAARARTLRIATAVFEAVTEQANDDMTSTAETIAGCMAGALALITAACGQDMAARAYGVNMAIAVLRDQARAGSTTLPTTGRVC